MIPREDDVEVVARAMFSVAGRVWEDAAAETRSRYMALARVAILTVRKLDGDRVAAVEGVESDIERILNYRRGVDCKSRSWFDEGWDGALATTRNRIRVALGLKPVA